MTKQSEKINSTYVMINSEKLNICCSKDQSSITSSSLPSIENKENVYELLSGKNNLSNKEANFSYNLLLNMGVEFVIVRSVKEHITETKLSYIDYFMFMNKSKKIDPIIAVKTVLNGDQAILKIFENRMHRVNDFRETYSDKQPIKLKDYFKLISLLKFLSPNDNCENLLCEVIEAIDENNGCTSAEAEEIMNLTGATYIGPFDHSLES